MIQFVFYLGYLLMSMPAARLLERIGWKMSVVAGLVGMAASAASFVPADMHVVQLTYLLIAGGALPRPPATRDDREY